MFNSPFRSTPRSSLFPPPSSLLGPSPAGPADRASEYAAAKAVCTHTHTEQGKTTSCAAAVPATGLTGWGNPNHHHTVAADMASRLGSPSPCVLLLPPPLPPPPRIVQHASHGGMTSHLTTQLRTQLNNTQARTVLAARVEPAGVRSIIGSRRQMEIRSARTMASAPRALRAPGASRA